MDRTRRTLSIAVLALIIVVAVVYEFVIPQVKAYQQLCATLHAKQAQVNSDRSIANSLKTETVAFNQTKGDLDKAGQDFTHEMRDGSSEVLLGLRSATTNVTITSVKPGLIVEKSNHLELPMDITASGNFLNVVAFYSDLERLTNLTDLQIFKIVAAPTAYDDSNVTIAISMVIFSAKTPTAKLVLNEISNWAIGRSNVFKPLNGFGQAGAPSQAAGTTQLGGTTPGLPSVPALPQAPLEPFSSGVLESADGNY